MFVGQTGNHVAKRSDCIKKRVVKEQATNQNLQIQSNTAKQQIASALEIRAWTSSLRMSWIVVQTSVQLSRLCRNLPVVRSLVEAVHTFSCCTSFGPKSFRYHCVRNSIWARLVRWMVCLRQAWPCCTFASYNTICLRS